MRTAAVVIRSLDDDVSSLRDPVVSALMGSAKHVVMIFIERNKMFLFNDPHVMLESEKVLTIEQKLHRKAIATHLEKAAQVIRKTNQKIEISKLVISGDEKYKIRKCLACLEIEAVVFVGSPRRKRFYEFFFQSLEDYVFEGMRVPIVKMPGAQGPHAHRGLYG